MQIVYLFALIGVLLGFVALVYYLPAAEQEQLNEYQDEARQLITQFTKSGEYIGFDVDPEPPVTKYVYEPKEKIVEVELENGTKVNQTTTEMVRVPVDESNSQDPQQTTLDVTIKDRINNQAKQCKLGYHCDITGTIALVDPATGKKIDPPYSYLITIDCDFREFCNLVTLSSNEVTFPDGTFKYTWVPTNPVQPGEYAATVYVTSYYTNQDGENERRLAERRIVVTE